MNESEHFITDNNLSVEKNITGEGGEIIKEDVNNNLKAIELTNAKVVFLLGKLKIVLIRINSPSCAVISHGAQDRAKTVNEGKPGVEGELMRSGTAIFT
ncbi:hypothetical protein Trydic_g16426 [Trypoxylus dichotomus]